MYNKKIVKRLLKKNYFSKALAKNAEKKYLSQDEKIWAYYNLGMYRTASLFQNEDLNCLGLYAHIISLAACGQFKDAEDTLLNLRQKKDCSKYIIPCADALSPFLPDLAYELLHNVRSPSTLYAALLLKLGKVEKAYMVLKTALDQKEYRKYPELLLYFSNSSKQLQAKTKLKLVNMYLLMYDVPKLVLINKKLPFNTMNICSHKKEKFSGPLVTIIMTTYNSGRTADVAIKSLLMQSYQNLELLVVDDASEDDTSIIIKEWEKKDNRVKLIKLRTNVGTYVAKNIGLLYYAKGEFVTCHDSDDWSHPLKIERQAEPLIKNRRLVATMSAWVRVSEDGEFYARPVHPLMRQNPSSLMFKKDVVLKEAGIWDCVRTGADSEFIARLKLVFGRKKVKRIKQPLSFGAHRADSLMNAPETGYCEQGMSIDRLDYWEAWGQWHIDELKEGKKPFISKDLLSKRKFQAPSSILVNKKQIEIVTKKVK